MAKYPTIAGFKTAGDLQDRLSELELSIKVDEKLQTGADAPLARPIKSSAGNIGNRFCILPMEGWDGTPDGRPTELTTRRWKNFGVSGAKLIWGGEAFAVLPEGRANPNQLMLNSQTIGEIETLRKDLVAAQQEATGDADDLVCGLQLTHSGRFARPNEKAKIEPRTVYQHPILDKRCDSDMTQAVVSDDNIKEMVDAFIEAAVLSEKIGFDFVDIKHCHGYFGHELLSGYDRPGEFGGSLENRSRFLRDIVAGIRAKTSTLQIGVRLSIFDFLPFMAGSDGIGQPEPFGDYQHAFGGTPDGQGVDLAEPLEFLKTFKELGIELVCTTASSPYYTPHVQRPAAFPPSDGYFPPEDPLVGVDRQIMATAALKRELPDIIFVGSGYSYLQQWLPNVAQACVREGLVDSIGLGRMALSYPDLPVDVLKGQPMQRKKICRTFSDCTTAPRNGMVSGCYPLDPFYKERPERSQLIELKKAATKLAGG